MNLETSSSDLRTPANPGLRDAAGQADSQSGSHAIRPYSGSKPGHALSNRGGRAIELARTPVATPSDIIVSRSSNGTAMIRHRRGGGDIGEVLKTDGGQWTSRIGGRQLAPHVHQRAALMELLSVHNRGSLTANHLPDSEPLQPAPQQTPLMERFGIPAIAAQLATPTNGSSDGGRMTSAGGSDSDSDDDTGGPAGLSPRGVAIYKKLTGRGMKPAQALAMARNSQNMGSGSFQKAG
jgi:hypothetical protein